MALDVQEEDIYFNLASGTEKIPLSQTELIYQGTTLEDLPYI